MPKHILHMIETTGPGGAEKVLVSMVEALAGIGIVSTVALFREGWLSRALRERGAEVVLLARGPGRLAEFAWLARTRELIRRRGIELLHAHEFRMNSYAALLSTLTGVPAVTTVHGRNYYGDRLRRRLVYRFVARRSAMVAVSDDIGLYLHDRLGIPEARIHVIPNGIDASRFHFSEGARRELRSRLGYSDQAQVIGAVGSLYPVKGHELLVRAAADLTPRFPHLQVFIAGSGGEEGALRCLAAELGVTDRVRLLGHREDIPALLSAADIFALPSRSEGHPLSLLEAMAARRPVVAAAVGGVPEVIADGSNGLLFRGGDHRALATALTRLLEDPLRCRGLASAGYGTVVRDYGIGTMLRRYLALYAQRLGEPALPLAGVREPGA